MRFYKAPPASVAGHTINKPMLEFAAELRKNRGLWAIYPFTQPGDSSLALVGRVNQNKMVSLPANEFEAVFRNGYAYVRCRRRKIANEQA